MDEQTGRYRVRDVDPIGSPMGSGGTSTWKVTFERRDVDAIVDIALDSVTFVGLDLDALYEAGDLMRLHLTRAT
jgi:hypothetical protein